MSLNVFGYNEETREIIGPLFNRKWKRLFEYLDYQIPVTQLNGDKQAAKRD